MQFLNDFVRTLIQTVVEIVVLVAMFAFWMQGNIPVVIVIGLVGFFLESIADKAARSVPIFGSLVPTIVLVVTETVEWIVAFLIFDALPQNFLAALGAGTFLFAIMIFQHTWEDNVAHGRGIFSPIVDFKTVPPSELEGIVAGGVWLYVASGVAGLVGLEQILVAVVLLFFGLSVEHALGHRLAVTP